MAAPPAILDEYIFVEPPTLQKVTDNVFALVGDMAQRAPENLGNNATFGFIVTRDGVVLIDPGGSFQGAQQIHQAIQAVTDKPVVLVINTGGQDHRWLGNDYFKQRGARIVAARDAVADQQARFNQQIERLEKLVGVKPMRGTKAVHADETFDTALDLTVGGIAIQIRHPGPAHTPGDSYVWLPEQKVMFSGDITYVVRMLAVGPMSNTRGWLKAFEAMAAHKPKHIVPGHGYLTTLPKARAATYDYLHWLRAEVKKFIDAGGGLESVNLIDQSRFSNLVFYYELSALNAQQVYLELEWE